MTNTGKRKLADTNPNEGEPRRRQPQISCNLCRQKKLKCDRLRPCSNCVSRQQACEGGPGPVVGLEQLSDVERRLRRLEQAVFETDSLSSSRSVVEHPATAAETGSRRPRPSADLDDAYTGDGDATQAEAREPIIFRVAESLSSSPDRQPDPALRSSRSVWMPTPRDGLVLYDYFLRTSQFLPLIMHEPAVRPLFSRFDVDTVERHNRNRHDAACAALVLAICATSAFFWESGSGTKCPVFGSGELAARQATAWQDTAWDLLDQCNRVAGPGCLEQVQALVVLCDLMYNTEGCSTRFRSLQSSAIAVAREISLHLTDADPPSPDNPDPCSPLQETKRRVWWFLASTDWLLAMMGGPFDRTYTVNPRHMAVAYPLNVNTSEPTKNCPPETATNMTYFLLRTHLAEACRRVVDALPFQPSSPGQIQDLPYERVVAIRRILESGLEKMPPCFAIGAPIPKDATSPVVLERQIIHLCFNARQAKLFRPFLVPRKDNADPRFTEFRELCLRSARTVLQLSSRLLEDSLNLVQGTAHSPYRPLLHRTGTIITHLFVACIILVTDPGSQAPAEAEEIRLELARARFVLGRAGERSHMAASLVKKLVGVLEKHRVQAVERSNDEETTPRSITDMASQTTSGENLPSAGAETSIQAGSTMQHGGVISIPALVHHEPLGPAEVFDQEVWNFGAGDSELWDGMSWTDFGQFGGGKTWNQLFADLEATSTTAL
ncbi:hypothetical protein QBC47DRAFT_169427 [Echria macrotheca]|uniref:Zn(2)-C6 fungal-type domain-containing protein n=1 Tax=Echria macrotheca TaxID=438768 RepID=A0AAJ0BF08_9PEZI|nr:hypothetical protein QBC47DRAFT_169427 [Echria macrotheca]